MGFASKRQILRPRTDLVKCRGRHWQTSQLASVIAAELGANVEVAKAGALLHDLGKVVLNCYFSDFYGAVLDLVQTEGMRIVDAEQEILG